VDAESAVAGGALPAALVRAVNDLYRVFGRYGLRTHIEGCPCCTTEEDQKSVRVRSLRALTADDLERYLGKAMTTWGDTDDFRHFLPRLLELMVSDPDGTYLDPRYLLPKLAYADWGSWPVKEQAAVESFLLRRWEVGLTQPPRYSSDHRELEFDADEWISGLQLTGLDPAPYIDAWRRLGTAATMGHVAAYLDSNPYLLTRGTSGPGRHTGTPAGRFAEQMRTWLSACMDDPDFQQQLAAWYQP
jgi:hypothetical protein